MTRTFRLLMIAFLATALLASCSGEDGDPGPKGDSGEQGDKGDAGDDGADGEDGEDAAAKSGFLQGTLKGIRRDGTAFEETFQYEYVFGDEIFTGKLVLLQRFETASGAIADAVFRAAQDAGYSIDAPTEKGYMKLSALKEEDGMVFDDFRVFYTKGISASQIFQLKARPHLEDAYYDRVIELSPEQNGLYNFDRNNKGQLGFSEYDTNNDGTADANAFTTYREGRYHTFLYALETGELTSIDIEGDIVQEGALFDKYNDIRFVYDDTLKMYVFVKASDGTPLYEHVEEVPADEFIITNYKVEEGVISFDFSLKISKYRGYMGAQGPMGQVMIHGENTTHHDLTIAGKFNSGGKVYTETVARVGG